ncbi:MAG: hypothetical protein DCC65_07715 [Planctomycetota bacterium]|nr:MAG: hypothetical protein DCC65_07715 [Planctomycetota bacterium]
MSIKRGRFLFSRLRVAVWLASVVVAALSGSCVESPSDRYERALVNTGKPALHAVHKERLRTIMQDMSRLAFESLPQEMDSQALNASRSEELVSVAEALAVDARAIPGILEDVRISSEDRRVFNSYAEKLHEEAKELAELARQRRMDDVRGKMDEMVSTCNACHSSFRVLPRATAGSM